MMVDFCKTKTDDKTVFVCDNPEVVFSSSVCVCYVLSCDVCVC